MISHTQQSEKQFSLIERNRLASEKMHLIATLIETARSRTRLTTQMFATTDLFERDEINIELDRQANRFARTHLELVNLPLNQQEQRIIELQNSIVAHILPIQRNLATLAMSGNANNDEINQLLYGELIPGQGRLIDLFMQMLTMLKDAVHQSTLDAQEIHIDYEKSQHLMILLFITISIIIVTITLRRTMQIEESLQQERDRARTTLFSIADAVVTIDNYGCITDANDAATSLLHRTSSQLLGKPIASVFRNSTSRVDNIGNIINSAIAQAEVKKINNCAFEDSQNKKYSIDILVSPISSQFGVTGAVITMRDVTMQRLLNQKLEYQAQHDSLTGLLNRHTFETEFELRCNDMKSGQQHTLCVLDLDRFKIINDSCGHKAGDKVLIQISEIIQSTVRGHDLLARIGGDEFTILLENCNTTNAKASMEHLLLQIAEYRYYHAEQTFSLGCSIGLVPVTFPVDSYAKLFNSADTACLLAKEQGRNRIVAVEPDSAQLSTSKERSNWLYKIQHAIDYAGFLLYHQTITPLDPALPVMHELLIRMDDNGEIILPMGFLPMAERYNLVHQIDLFVLREAIHHLNTRHFEGMITINLSAVSITNPQVCDDILHVVRHRTFDKHKLCFEIAETAVMSNLITARQFLQQLRQAGCQVALDDFGTGLSSFTHLDSLPVDYIKIDGCFIQQIMQSSNTRSIIEAMHSLSCNLDIKTVAEYVDSPEIVDIITEIGFHYAQGFYIDKPQPIDLF